MRQYLYFSIIVLCASGVAFFIVTQSHQSLPVGIDILKAQEQDRKNTIIISSGDTFAAIAVAQEMAPPDAQRILESCNGTYDFTSIRAGKELTFYHDYETNRLYKLTYEPTTEDIVTVTKNGEMWRCKKNKIQYDVQQKTVASTIESSLYETGLALGVDERAILDLADMFAWQVDFGVDIRSGDSFTMIYEERYRNGTYVMPGRIIAAAFINNGTTFRGYRYRDGDREEYFDENGTALQKIFLKSPLRYRYISSGFTSTRRDPITRNITAHYAIDYAAPHGTPAVSVGDGSVIFAGWRGGYGYSVDVRHNETYTTRYGHFSRLAVKIGQQVKQGDIVGYVGSTGHSTGPHLHYEMYKHGSKVNPYTIDIPSGKALGEGSLPAFQEYIKQFKL